MKNNNLINLLVLASMWGPSFLFIKVAVQAFPPLTLVTIRLALAALLLYIILRARGGRLATGKSLWAKFFFMSFFANALPFTLFSIGEQYADSAAAAILNGTTPIFTVIFAHFMIAEERLSLQRLAGVLVGFGGVLLIFLEELRAFFSGDGLTGGLETIGLLMFIAASICYGISIAFSRKYLRGLPPLVGPATQMTTATIIMLPLMFIFEQPFSIQPTLPAATSLIILSIWGTALAYLVFYKLVETASATFLSLVTYLLPPIGVILGVLFLGEQPGWNAMAGLALIIFGVMSVNGAFGNAWQRLRMASAA